MVWIFSGGIDDFTGLGLGFHGAPGFAVDKKIGDVEIGSNLFPDPLKLRPLHRDWPVMRCEMFLREAVLKPLGPLTRCEVAW